LNLASAEFRQRSPVLESGDQIPKSGDLRWWQIPTNMLARMKSLNPKND
jgi:hypothetical protein